MVGIAGLFSAKSRHRHPHRLIAPNAASQRVGRLNLPSDVHDGESHIRLSRCLARSASINHRSEKLWRKSGRPNGGLGTKASSLGKRTRSRQNKRSEFDKSSRAMEAE